MRATILGSGSPVPLASRGGQSIALTIDGNRVLVDCGPMTVERLLENGYRLGEFETVFFTHQHMDHNASFFHFAISSWMYGRGRLTVYGPAGTENLVDALERVYAEDWAYREQFGRDIDAAIDIEFVRTDGSFELERETWTATLLPVDHSIETYAYRIEDRLADETFVYAADTSKIDELASFAEGADVLVYAAAAAPAGTFSDDAVAGDRNSWEQYTASNPEPTENSPFVENHSTPADAAEIADAADVGALVVTHHLPARDLTAARESAEGIFSGELHFAEDGFDVPI